MHGENPYTLHVSRYDDDIFGPGNERERLLKVYMKDVRRYKRRRTLDEELQYFKDLEAATGGMREVLIDQFVLNNLAFVAYIAFRFLGHGLDLMDLIQEGNIGLMEAVERFDWRHGKKFAAYASSWIRQKMSRAIDDQHGETAVRVPVHVMDVVKRVRKGQTRFLAVHGRKATPFEMLEQLRTEDAERGREPIALAKLGMALKVLNRRYQSLDESSSEEDPESTSHHLFDNGHTSALTVIHAREQLETLSRFLEKVEGMFVELSVRDREIVYRRFGFGYRPQQTLQEIGDELGITRERVRQIEEKAVLHVSHQLHMTVTAERLRRVIDMVGDLTELIKSGE